MRFLKLFGDYDLSLSAETMSRALKLSHLHVDTHPQDEIIVSVTKEF